MNESDSEQDDGDFQWQQDSDGSFDDDGGEELFDIFTGEVANAASQAYEETAPIPNAVEVPEGQNWQWVPLRGPNQIRLIVLDTSSPLSDALPCNMTTTDLERPCAYYTLSYAWGDTHTDWSHLTHVIDCDGIALRITQNLHDALTRIRRLWSLPPAGRPLQPLPVWIDAICIDQHNPVERSRQVMMMDRIYKSSAHLLIWLGLKVAEPVDVLIHAQELTFHERDVLVARVVEDSPWFRRRWVIQEAASQPSASSSILGSTGLLSVKTMRAWLESSDVHRPGDAGPLRERAVAPLVINLFWHLGTLCSDDRDKVYALRSVSEDGAKLTVDYTKTTEEVYCAVASLCANEGLMVPLLILASGSRYSETVGHVPRMPSWVPDWRKDRLYLWSGNTAESDTFDDLQGMLDQWARHPDVHSAKNADGCSVLYESIGGRIVMRLQLTGWVFRPCKCCAPEYAEDCLHCLVERFSTVSNPDWLCTLRSKTILMLPHSPVLPVLSPEGDGTYRLESCTKLPEGQNLAGRIGRYWVTESGKFRELEDIVLI